MAKSQRGAGGGAVSCMLPFLVHARLVFPIISGLLPRGHTSQLEKHRAGALGARRGVARTGPGDHEAKSEGLCVQPGV